MKYLLLSLAITIVACGQPEPVAVEPRARIAVEGESPEAVTEPGEYVFPAAASDGVCADYAGRYEMCGPAFCTMYDYDGNTEFWGCMYDNCDSDCVACDHAYYYCTAPCGNAHHTCFRECPEGNAPGACEDDCAETSNLCYQACWHNMFACVY